MTYYLWQDSVVGIQWTLHYHMRTSKKMYKFMNKKDATDGDR